MPQNRTLTNDLHV